MVNAGLVTVAAFAWQLVRFHLPSRLISLHALTLDTTQLHTVVLEYYWHRLMHIPFFYRHLHKLHHHYKSQPHARSRAITRSLPLACRHKPSFSLSLPSHPHNPALADTRTAP
eukprot:3662720-Rhodomonas_salina.1